MMVPAVSPIMPTSKKTTPAPATKPAKASAITTRVHLPEAPAPVKSAAELKAAAAIESAVAQSRAAQQVQMQQWQQAMELFGQRKFAVAQAKFTEAASGPAAHIADKARSYAQICARKTDAGDVNLHTADDHFNYGVERLNARDMDVARRHLDRALVLEPNGEHILFTLALCCGLLGDGTGAYENLRRAIVLEPRNRILARQDPEFLALANQVPAVRTLLTDGVV